MSNAIDLIPELPDDVEGDLWFECKYGDGKRDYLFDAHGHTFPGRMAAWCPDRGEVFRISLAEVPAKRGTATDWWIKGFLAGNLPPAPAVDDDDPSMSAWKQNALSFASSGYWPTEGSAA